MQSPHPMQRFSSTCDTVPSASNVFLDRMVAALAAAPQACEMLSSMNFGQCAIPQRKTPSVAKSTGRSFMWASKKKPSFVKGTLSISAIRLLSGFGMVAALKTIKDRINFDLFFNYWLPESHFKLSFSFTTFGFLFIIVIYEHDSFCCSLTIINFFKTIRSNILVQNVDFCFWDLLP